jgi:hypothetical protein
VNGIGKIEYNFTFIIYNITIFLLKEITIKRIPDFSKTYLTTKLRLFLRFNIVFFALDFAIPAEQFGFSHINKASLSLLCVGLILISGLPQYLHLGKISHSPFYG